LAKPYSDISSLYTAKSTSLKASSVTPGTPADELLFFSGIVGSTQIIADPGMPRAWAVTNLDTTSYAAYQQLTSTAATGDRIAESKLFVQSISQLVALNSAIVLTPSLVPSVSIPVSICPPRPSCGKLPCALPQNWCHQTPPVSGPPPPPSVSPAPGSTILSITLGLHGIGSSGDNANPNSHGNQNPLHPARTITVQIYDAGNQLVMTQQATVNYNSGTGKFTGIVDLGTQFATGIYTVKIKTEQYLRALVPGTQTITAKQTTPLPLTTLIVGDINGDNQINIIDYSILIGCYSDLLPAQSCTSQNQRLADLDDDGKVDFIDYNLILRELINVPGQ